MNLKIVRIVQCVIILAMVVMTMGHVEVLEDEDDFDYDYNEEEMRFNEEKPKLKKPIPEPKNPIREKNAFVRDEQHVREHMAYPDALDSKDDKSVEFHFFTTHDLDKDNHLDGLELFKAIEHSMGAQIDNIMQDSKIHQNTKIRKVGRMYIQLEATIDKILNDDDANRDGYLAYSEFANARLSSKIARDAF